MSGASSRYKAVIYDCDGVMFDSMRANFAFYRSVMDHMELSLDWNDPEVIRIIHTYANREVMNHFFTDTQEREKAIRFAGTIDYRSLIPLMQMEAGFRNTLDELKGRVNLAVCTNRSTSMDAVLEGFGLADYFSFVMTAAKSTLPKPHPEPLLRILDHYGLRAEEALFVGDSAVDSQAASAANVPFVAYKADLPGMTRIDRHEEILSLILMG
ncbi:MAG TPA: HAD family hydrolase [Geobacteraceae bacterium]|nr:HAD family hydrolase [Geobacteraceae bacterium]